ncbi:S-adenosyl-L-methionine-dependent methyltransferase [Punctularia strigosozonata HHB-11173 SS5]|uniref:S-adenosyl-L-methionine-dependent methyltransferase n=1 Tax=Punctularia strigosozonata (strain HHB-11173) TaxID=741275 RepID=UPI00044162C5|nr:S-adenosyl-L-methionine-dependent methyltransferase [Punctularia strigosozonata HHB-11173 SS5]EIN09801.1 S-adenosyl-L-methionine-dependent methyltransferase [Punctularia strigosozonata HHB-11173 SS5]
MATAELQPSKLGRKDHWDNIYSKELQNFEEIGDEGEVWFGEDSVEKMVSWALDNVPPSSRKSLLEVGSGNGTLLFAMCEAGYSPEYMLGIDYSADAVKLARAIAPTRGAENLAFEECDFLHGDVPSLGGEAEGWDLIMDKGTYDAIALGEKDEHGRSPAAGYPRRLANLLRPDGFFLITSCNFTEDELRSSFETAATGLKYHSRVQHRSFTFGGQSGQTISTVAFYKPA